jgi:hypothetical protein
MSKTTNPTAAAPQPQLTVTLLKPHTHERKPMHAGEQLTVREGLAKWLVENGIAEVVKS